MATEEVNKAVQTMSATIQNIGLTLRAFLIITWIFFCFQTASVSLFWNLLYDVQTMLKPQLGSFFTYMVILDQREQS